MTDETDRMRQNVVWLPPRRMLTVLSVDDQRRTYKRAFAAQLLMLRAESQVGSQADAAKIASTSEATYRRWEDGEKTHLPDAWQITKLCERFGVDLDRLVHPEELNGRETELARKAARAAGRGVHRAAGTDQGHGE